MKLIKYHIIFLLLTSVLFAQMQPDALKSKISRTGMNLQRLKKPVSAVDNANVHSLFEEAVVLWQKARENYELKRYTLSYTFLMQANTKIMQITKLLSDLPVFRERYLLKLENNLRRAERKIGDSPNPQARFYLEQAYEFQKQGLRQLKESDNPLHGIELLAVANKFAERSIQLASNQDSALTQTDFLQRINEISTGLNEYKNSRVQLARENLKQIRRIQQIINQAKRLWNSGNQNKAGEKLKVAERLTAQLIYSGTGRYHVVKLYRQFQQQKQFAQSYSPEGKPQMAQNVFQRIQHNLNTIENAFNNEKYVLVRNKLNLNHKLIRTLEGLHGNDKDRIRVNLTRKIEQLTQKNNAALQSEIITESEHNRVSTWLNRAQQALAAGRPVLCTRILTMVNSYLNLGKRKENEKYTAEKIQNTLKQLEFQIKNVSSTELKGILSDLLLEARTAFENNNYPKCIQLIRIIKKQIKKNQ